MYRFDNHLCFLFYFETIKIYCSSKMEMTIGNELDLVKSQEYLVLFCNRKKKQITIKKREFVHNIFIQQLIFNRINFVFLV